MAKKSLMTKMLKFFNLTVDKGSSNNPHDNTESIYPAKYDPRDGLKGKPKNLVKGSFLEYYYNLYVTETLDTAASFKNREDRYKDLEFAYANNGYFSQAVELYATEATQSDAQNKVLNVFAKDRKVEKYIIEFFNKIGITNNLLNSMSFDIALFADHFWALSVEEGEGVTDITPLNPYFVKDRIEFSALEVAKQRRQGDYSNLGNKSPLIQRILDVIEQENKGEDAAAFFKKYLIGFALEEDMVLPPWQVMHFRRLTTSNEFAPYGRPILINAIGPFRQLQSAKTLMAMARASNFPIKSYEVDVSDKMTEMDKWEAIEEAKAEYKNLGVTSTSKEKFVIDSETWTPKDLIELTITDPGMNLDQIGDVELLINEMITAVGIPEGYIPTPGGSGFGDSGKALLQQAKIFGRRVYTIQTSILDGLVSLVRMHLAMTGDLPEDVEFELSLNFPVVEESSEKMGIKSDSLRLAQDVLTSISDAVGLDSDEALPPQIIRDVFSDISFLDGEDVDKWLVAIKKQEDEKKDDNENTQESTRKRSSKALKEKLKTRLSEKQRKTLVREAYFNYKKENGLDEGVLGKRHFYSSNSHLEAYSKRSQDIYKRCIEKTKLEG